jgi:23S rRNA pseudouridine2605 synthase
MKKASGFDKFFKGREKTGGAKKEEFRQDKRKERKEREEKIANSKREKRAQYKASFSNEPPKYNLEPPGKRSFKKSGDERPAPSYRGDKKKIELRQKPASNSGDQKFSSNSATRKFSSNSGNQRFTSSPSSQKPPYKSKDQKFSSNSDTQKPAFKSNNQKFSSNPETQKSTFKSNNQKPASHPDSQKPAFNQGKRIYKKEGPKLSEGPKPVEKKTYLPKKIVRSEVVNVPVDPAPKAKKPITISKPMGEGEEMPLNKYIAHSGVCSRREAVNLIKSGKVKVNGELVLEPGHKVVVIDDVRVSGKKLNPVKDFVYILLNKPKDYITTTDDPQERKTVLDLLKGAPPIRIYPVGRLDRNTSGVLLLTNDGDLAQGLTHPSNEIKKVYSVTLDKPLTKLHFEAILKGVVLEDGVANIDSLAFADGQDLTQLGIELHTGRNRIVRRIFEHLGYDVKALDRVIFAGLTKKNVDRGKWRYLAEKEVRDLKFFKKGRS